MPGEINVREGKPRDRCCRVVVVSKGVKQISDRGENTKCKSHVVQFNVMRCCDQSEGK